LPGCHAIIRGFEIDQRRDTLGIHLGESRHLVSGNRMADEVNAFEFQRLRDIGDIFDEPLEFVATLRLRRRAKPAPSECDDAGVIGQVSGEVVKDMGGIPVTREQYDRRPRTAPI
jgi:hypothetical protein